MKTKQLAIAVLMAACLPALAHTGPAPGIMAHARAAALAAPLMIHEGKVVKNAPYSAQAVSEKVQSLSDGNQITVRTATSFYRDSAGRTRREMTTEDGEVRTIIIRDADGATTILRPRDKTATRVKARREMAAAAREQARARIEQLRKEGKLPGGAAGREAVAPTKGRSVATTPHSPERGGVAPFRLSLPRLPVLRPRHAGWGRRFRLTGRGRRADGGHPVGRGGRGAAAGPGPISPSSTR